MAKKKKTSEEKKKIFTDYNLIESPDKWEIKKLRFDHQ